MNENENESQYAGQGNEVQSADNSAAWVDGVRVCTYQTAPDTYEEMVLTRGGIVLDHYTLALDGDGETRTEFHRLKSNKGKKLSADEIPSGFAVAKGRYNTITREIQL